MSLTKKIKDYVGTLALGAALTFGGGNYALAKTSEPESKPKKPAPTKLIKAKGSVELMAGHKTATLDTKLLLKYGDRLTFMNRNRMISDYEGNISTFHMAKLGYRLVDGLSVTAGMMGTSKVGIRPQAGLDYFLKLREFSLYQLAFVSGEEDPKIMSLTNLSYTPELSENWALVLGLENVSFFSKDGHNISIQRPRVGVQYGPIQAGMAVDFTIDKEGKFKCNFGGSGKVNF